jgi:hypothetical protein
MTERRSSTRSWGESTPGTNRGFPRVTSFKANLPRDCEDFVFPVDMGVGWEVSKRRIGVTSDVLLYKAYHVFLTIGQFNTSQVLVLDEFGHGSPLWDIRGGDKSTLRRCLRRNRNPAHGSGGALAKPTGASLVKASEVCPSSCLDLLWAAPWRPLASPRSSPLAHLLFRRFHSTLIQDCQHRLARTTLRPISRRSSVVVSGILAG